MLFKIRRAVFADFKNIERCEGIPWAATLDARGQSTFADQGDAEYALHFIVRSLDKIFRNRTIYQSSYDYNDLGPSIGGMQESSAREIVALPALSAVIEVRLILLERNKVMWSTLQDSTILVPNDNHFVYNAEKYPGFTHPEIIRDYIAPILRQRQRRPAALRMLSAADRWYLSRPVDDVAVANALLDGMVEDLLPAIDARLPLYGSIVSLMGTDEKKRPRFQLDIGSRQGLVEKLRLDVFSQKTTAEKVGQIEIVAVDSSSSIARLHKLERSARRRGETIAIGDRVFSRRRPPQSVKRNTP